MNFITGNGFKAKCKRILDGDGYRINCYDYNNYFFVKTDYLEEFQKLLPSIEKPIVLITHNSDYGITEKWKPILESPKVVQWLAQNVEYEHYKLSSIPIGLTNGDGDTLAEVMAMDIPKTKIIHVSYSICTNRDKRNVCQSETGIQTQQHITNFRDYYIDLAGTRFVISPEGNGVDCVRTWEALYLKTIPIVTNCINVSFYSDLPILVLNSWKDFKGINFSEDLYIKMWDNFDPSILTCEYYLEKYRCVSM